MLRLKYLSLLNTAFPLFCAFYSLSPPCQGDSLLPSCVFLKRRENWFEGAPCSEGVCWCCLPPSQRSDRACLSMLVLSNSQLPFQMTFHLHRLVLPNGRQQIWCPNDETPQLLLKALLLKNTHSFTMRKAAAYPFKSIHVYSLEDSGFWL